MRRRSRSSQEPDSGGEPTSDWPTPWVDQKPKGEPSSEPSREDATPPLEVEPPAQEWPGPESVPAPWREPAARPRAPSERSSRGIIVTGLIVATTAVVGFLAGASDLGEDGSSPAQREGTGDDAAARTEARRSAELRRALSELDSRRAVGRRRLARARTRGGQERSARALARAYESTARSLPGTDSPGAVRGLQADLTAAARAYRGLARAARRGSRRGYRGAREAVNRRDVALQRDLERLSS